jgi:hypothetical protein
MRTYFKEQRRASAEDRVYELNRLTLKMLGSLHAPTLKAKAAETRGMLGLTVHVLEAHQAALGDKACTRACFAGGTDTTRDIVHLSQNPPELDSRLCVVAGPPNS